MGRQIQILLSEADEERLIQHLQMKFPVVAADCTYPHSWDRRTLTKTCDASTWVIVDERTIPILTEAAIKLAAEHPQFPGGWAIWSRAYSCVDWNRRFDSLPTPGRLYLNTTADPIWTDVSAVTGDDIELMYNRACRWIRANCINCKTSRRGCWVSMERVDEYQKMSRDSAVQPDPRDERFYRLKSKSPKRLTPEDRAALISYCDAMLDYVDGNPEAIESWQQYRAELLRLS